MLVSEPAGLLTINATFFVEVATFVLMIAILGRYVYPRIVAMAEARQTQVASELEAAETARKEAEGRLQAAEERLDHARAQAQDIISGAGKTGEQLRQELRQKAEEEARRLTERARSEIDAERRKAIDSVRGEVADLVVAATERVVGESLDRARHQKLIDGAIREIVVSPHPSSPARGEGTEEVSGGNGKR